MSWWCGSFVIITRRSRVVWIGVIRGPFQKTGLVVGGDAALRFISSWGRGSARGETETVVQIPKVGGDLLGLRSRHNMPVIRATGMVVLWGRAWRMTVQVDVDVDVIFVG